MEKTYKFLKLLIWLLLFAVLLAGAWVLYNNLSPMASMAGVSVVQTAQESTVPAPEAPTETTAPTVNPAPDFTVYDASGQAHKLSDFQGKPVLLNFWASWCGPCKSEMPDIEEAYQTYGDQIHFLIVNLTDGYQETQETAQSYLTDNGYTFPAYFDTQTEAAYAYGVNAVPVTYFIDGEGNLQAYFQGAMTADIIRQGVDLLLAE